MIRDARAALAAPTPNEHRVIPAMRNGVLRHPPTCVNCGQPVECPATTWQHVAAPTGKER